MNGPSFSHILLQARKKHPLPTPQKKQSKKHHYRIICHLSLIFIRFWNAVYIGRCLPPTCPLNNTQQQKKGLGREWNFTTCNQEWFIFAGRILFCDCDLIAPLISVRLVKTKTPRQLTRAGINALLSVCVCVYVCVCVCVWGGTNSKGIEGWCWAVQLVSIDFKKDITCIQVNIVILSGFHSTDELCIFSLCHRDFRRRTHFVCVCVWGGGGWECTGSEALHSAIAQLKA